MKAPWIGVEYFVGDLIQPRLECFSAAMGKHVPSMLESQAFQRMKVGILAQQRRGLLHFTFVLQHLD